MKTPIIRHNLMSYLHCLAFLLYENRRISTPVELASLANGQCLAQWQQLSVWPIPSSYSSLRPSPCLANGNRENPWKWSLFSIPPNQFFESIRFLKVCATFQQHVRNTSILRNTLHHLILVQNGAQVDSNFVRWLVIRSISLPGAAASWAISMSVFFTAGRPPS